MARLPSPLMGYVTDRVQPAIVRLSKGGVSGHAGSTSRKLAIRSSRTSLMARGSPRDDVRTSDAARSSSRMRATTSRTDPTPLARSCWLTGVTRRPSGSHAARSRRCRTAARRWRRCCQRALRRRSTTAGRSPRQERRPPLCPAGRGTNRRSRRGRGGSSKTRDRAAGCRLVLSDACHAQCRAGGQTYCHACHVRRQRGHELGTA